MCLDNFFLGKEGIKYGCDVFVCGHSPGTAASAALMAGVSLMSILLAGDWMRASTLSRYGFT